MVLSPITVNESAEAVIRANIFQHQNIAMVTEEGMVELVSEDDQLDTQQDKLFTTAAQQMMVCLYKNQLMHIFLRVAMLTLSINSCVQEFLSVGGCL